jgi:hypothetical protein
VSEDAVPKTESGKPAAEVAAARTITPGDANDRVHIIRLRGPWEYRVLAVDTTTASPPDATQATLPAGRIPMPADWGQPLGADFHGRVEYTRSFNRPTGLAAEQRVELVLAGLDAFGSATFNQQPLGEIPPGGAAARFNIGPLLLDRNTLVVEVELPRSDERADCVTLRPAGREHLPGGLYGEVRLEIRE